jgi:DNA-binding response OmpR family regulator
VITTEVASSTLQFMTETIVLLVATDADHIYREVEASVGDNYQVLRVRAGAEVLDAVIAYQPVVIVLDLQIGNMGGMAVCLDLRLEQRAGRIGTQRVVMLLDREADVFLGRRAEANAWLVKPIDQLALSRLINEVLAGQPA